ncbi:hypothetical protein AVEN_88528-1 [Araneus ventricosus]|uniref:Uncharacterized protein n=1 Tax=Araneus ventricosus TaxID=182803 RepID=A0A4Y2E4R9_ARAVE|nr:hypothetical protein AVEN_88528-1 [Araneus ventricosus]
MGECIRQSFEDDNERRVEFCEFILQNVSQDENFLMRFVFSNDATFHLIGEVSSNSVGIWCMEQPHEIVQHERASTKDNVFVHFLGKRCMTSFSSQRPLLRE